MIAWTYSQKTGRLLYNGEWIATGYSGHGAGLNNPDMQDVLATGPVPRGVYTIEDAFTHPICGPIAMRLLPHPVTDTFGRSGFLIHGDNPESNHTASNGCIILPRTVRLRIAGSTDKQIVIGG